MEKKIFEGENAFEDCVQSMKNDGLCGAGESLAKHAKKEDGTTVFDSKNFITKFVNEMHPAHTFWLTKMGYVQAEEVADWDSYDGTVWEAMIVDHGASIKWIVEKHLNKEIDYRDLRKEFPDLNLKSWEEKNDLK